MNIFTIVRKLFRIPFFLYRFIRCELSGHLWRYEQRESMNFKELRVVMAEQPCVYCGIGYEKAKTFGCWFGAEGSHQISITQFPSVQPVPVLVQIEPLCDNSIDS